MSAFVHSGSIVFLILAIVVVEMILLFVLRHRFRPPLTLFAILRPLVPGVFLLLAVHDALTGAAWFSVALWLGLAGIAHAVDLRHRLTGR